MTKTKTPGYSASPKILFFMSCWAHECTLHEALLQFNNLEYDGVEGPWPEKIEEQQACLAILKEQQCLYIAEICTGGSYVPDRKKTINAHVEDLMQQLEQLPLNHIEKINCLFGADCWSLSNKIIALASAYKVTQKYGIQINFETHRGRCLFNPWETLAIVEALPALPLTLDISHWFTVCEGLESTTLSDLETLWPNVAHIHARVGYDQGPQIASFQPGPYEEFTQLHLRAWDKVIAFHKSKNDGIEFSITPEFGPDGYHYRNLSGRESLVDLSQLNRQVRELCKNYFTNTHSKLPTANSID